MYKVISTGSKGNCVIYHNSIMVDCGVPYSLISEYVNDIQIILLTHSHKDHINITTIHKLAFERPTLRFACGEWMVPLLDGIKNVDVLEIGKLYDYGAFKVAPVKLFHDVPNCGWRIFKGNHKTIHCTDTAHLKGITAKGYDLYAIEHNYNEDTIFESIRIKQERGEFTHQIGSINSHLSEQQARNFIFENVIGDYEILRLHESNTI